MKKTLVIMAAGMGSRYGGLKQVDGVGPSGELLIDYSIYDALHTGFDKVVFIIKRENDALFRDAIGDRVARYIDVRYVYQRLDDLPAGFSVPAGRVKPWGTAHAVMSCRDEVHEPFAVINADDFYGRQAFRLLSSWMDSAGPNAAEPMEFCMAGYILKNTLSENGAVSRGVCRLNPDGTLADVTERTKILRRGGRVVDLGGGGDGLELDENGLVSMNCWAFPPVFLSKVPGYFRRFLEENRGGLQKAEFYLPSVVRQMISRGEARVKVLPTADRWFGMTYREDRGEVRRAVARMARGGVYPDPLWKSGTGR